MSHYHRYYSRPTGHGRRRQQTYCGEYEDVRDVLVAEDEASQVISYKRLHGLDSELRELKDAQRLACNLECSTLCP